MSKATAMGVQSYCFRGFKDNAKVAESVKAIGVSSIELCGVHVDFLASEQAAGAIRTYRDAGVEIASIGVQGMSGDEAKERAYFEFVKACGARFISVDFPIGTIPKSFRVAEKLAEEFDVRLGIHNHGGRHWLGGGAALEWVFAQTSERIGLCLDTAWALDSREDPIAVAKRFAGRLYGVHIKDFVFKPDRTPEDVVVGTGNLDLPGFLKTLTEIGYAGVTVLEYEGDVQNPVPALSKCVEAVRRAG